MASRVSPGRSPAKDRLTAISEPQSRATPSRSWLSWVASTMPIGAVIGPREDPHPMGGVGEARRRAVEGVPPDAVQRPDHVVLLGRLEATDQFDWRLLANPLSRRPELAGQLGLDGCLKIDEPLVTELDCEPDHRRPARAGPLGDLCDRPERDGLGFVGEHRRDLPLGSGQSIGLSHDAVDDSHRDAAA